MDSVARNTVKKSLGPDPSMGRKVDLLRRLVAMREDQRKAGPVRPKRPFSGAGRGGGRPSWEGVPRAGADFASQPGYTFGPPRGVR